jgi:glutathione S-transferase
MSLPVLYSYRRCPYAIRARMALKYAGVQVEIREISLRDKPKHMITLSPKATVPVLALTDGRVIDESLDIMDWALSQQDQDGWRQIDLEAAMALIVENDGPFKRSLDAYKYPERHPEKTSVAHRQNGEVFLAKLEKLLEVSGGGLFGKLPTLPDIAIFPFIRQFKGVDSRWFESASYPNLNSWLHSMVTSQLFISVMEKHPTYIE